MSLLNISSFLHITRNFNYENKL